MVILVHSHTCKEQQFYCFGGWGVVGAVLFTGETVGYFWPTPLVALVQLETGITNADFQGSLLGILTTIYQPLPQAPCKVGQKNKRKNKSSLIRFPTLTILCKFYPPTVRIVIIERMSKRSNNIRHGLRSLFSNPQKYFM